MTTRPDIAAPSRIPSGAAANGDGITEGSAGTLARRTSASSASTVTRCLTTSRRRTAKGSATRSSRSSPRRPDSPRGSAVARGVNGIPSVFVDGVGVPANARAILAAAGS